MKNRHGIAIDVENISRRILNCNKGDFNGLVDANYIEIEPVFAMIFVLVHAINNDGSNISFNKIKNFIKSYSQYIDFSISRFQNENPELFEELFSVWQKLTK